LNIEKKNFFSLSSESQLKGLKEFLFHCFLKISSPKNLKLARERNE